MAHRERIMSNKASERGEEGREKGDRDGEFRLVSNVHKHLTLEEGGGCNICRLTRRAGKEMQALMMFIADVVP
jgi:hypothetical protein